MRLSAVLIVVTALSSYSPTCSNKKKSMFAFAKSVRGGGEGGTDGGERNADQMSEAMDSDSASTNPTKTTSKASVMLAGWTGATMEGIERDVNVIPAFDATGEGELDENYIRAILKEYNMSVVSDHLDEDMVVIYDDGENDIEEEGGHDDSNVQKTHDNDDRKIDHDRRHHRFLSSTTSIRISNDCGEPVNVAVRYRRSNGSWSTRYSEVESGEVKAVVSSHHYTHGHPFWYFYGESSTRRWDGDSRQYTWSGERMEKVRIDTYSRSALYEICGGDDDNNKAASPRISLGTQQYGRKPSSSSKPYMTVRELDWLNEQNSKRAGVHGSSSRYMFRWSLDLRDSAQRYADLLITIPGCVIRHNYGGDMYGGENLAVDFAPPGTYPTQRAVSDIVERWTTGEERLNFPNNLHRTQVLWKATKYTGCAEASKNWQGGVCNIQVCRYLSPGNCDINSWNWEQKMYEEASLCEPQEPKY